MLYGVLKIELVSRLVAFLRTLDYLAVNRKLSCW
jgi:hypothetical protein